MKTIACVLVFISMSIAVMGQTATTIDSTVVDVDGNVYHTVEIGSQIWMVENLRTSHYRNGDAIQCVAVDSLWEPLYIGAYCIYNNEPANELVYGKLYNYYALDDKRNIAPKGWRVATCADWDVLLEYLPTVFYLSGDSTFNNAKYIASPKYWKKSDVDGSVGFKANKNNVLKFFGLPAGYRHNSGVYKGLTTSAYWWCYSPSGTSEMLALSKSIWFDSNEIQTNLGFKMRGLSVRCVKDL